MKKIICLLVIFMLTLVGCGTKTVAQPAVEDLKAELISISELTIKPPERGITTEIIGTATNNNKKECNFDFEVIFINQDGSPLTTETIQVKDIKPGETKYFTGSVMDTDVSKTTHKVQFGKFFTYTKTK